MKKILIVDDEVNNRLLLEEILEDFKEIGVEILLASDGKQALDLIESERPNLVFLDIMMPTINGYEVCNVVKKELKLINIYIVLLTARGQKDDRDRGFEVLCDKYITKPFYFNEVIGIAEDVLELKIH
ncbi:response regulator [Clostridium lacusfryxellense]|uniref:response regulator n=1 Tax=Clostridium lacusfryxellense TaxID=205328 RepID=UPI001C0DD785|nr:response regulator [Clostridium lacusfryxellense]MBU3113101.1 response regulator [Clostridium lacusfryxellense]